MKRKIGCLTLCALASMGLACCNNEAKTYSLTVWTYYNGDTETSFQQLIKEYNNTQGKENHIAVDTISQGSSVNDLLDALIASANGDFGAKKMPELFLAYPDTAYEIDKKGKIAALDDYFSKSELANFNEGFLNEGRLGNDASLKVLPVAKSTEALYINKTDFDKFLSQHADLGIQYSDLETVEGIVEVSKKYYEATGKAFFGRDSLDNYFVISAKQLGIDVIGYNSENKFGINCNRDVFKKLWDCYAVPMVKGYFNADGNFRSSALKAGSILAYVGSTSSSSYFPRNVFDGEDSSHPIDCYVMPAPGFENKPKYAVSQGAGFCVSKSDEGTERACVDFLKWFTNKNHIGTFCASSGYFPATEDGFNEEFIAAEEDDRIKQTFAVAKKITKEYGMYTNKVGEGGNALRQTLKNSMLSYCTDALKEIKASDNKEEAIAKYCSDDKFEEWFASLAYSDSNIA